MSEGNRSNAQGAVWRALCNGTLVKPDNCSRCEKGGRLHAHHDDYAKPLEVIWLCPKHHIERHRELGWGHGGEVIRQMRTGKTKAEIRAIPRRPKKGRRRVPCTVTLRPDLAKFADEYFPNKTFDSLSRFIDRALLSHAKLKRDVLKQRGIEMPDENIYAQ